MASPQSERLFSNRDLSFILCYIAAILLSVGIVFIISDNESGSGECI